MWGSCEGKMGWNIVTPKSRNVEEEKDFCRYCMGKYKIEPQQAYKEFWESKYRNENSNIKLYGIERVVSIKNFFVCFKKKACNTIDTLLVIGTWNKH